ncbi:hypothetical protein [Thermosporothrix hazakensis]|nr:hypothetical protein [Thermosporothrix hazakensis]
MACQDSGAHIAILSPHLVEGEVDAVAGGPAQLPEALFHAEAV